MKRILSIFIVLILITCALCGCNKQRVYLMSSLKCYSEDKLVYTVNYTYDEDGRLLKEACVYETQSLRNYSDTYTYNAKGELVKLVKVEMGEETEYTAEKITKYKYLLTAADGRTITIIFDTNGHVVSFKNSDGYLLEYAYVYAKNGKPTALKKQIVNPSGSNKLFDYSIRFTDQDSYNCYDSSDSSYYYAVDCIIK